MKELSKTWFLNHPIDLEHKQYLLLDFLKSVNTEIKKDEIYHPIKKIFSLTRELSIFKSWLINKEKTWSSEISAEILNFYLSCSFSNEEEEELVKILNFSLEVLYKYSELGLDLWKGVEKRIKAFDLDNGNGEKTYGVLIFRNMATDEIFPYLWSSEIENPKGVMMKRVNLTNNYFSMTYEFIVHEIIQEIGMRNIKNLRVTVMEIQEDCNQDSIIIKIAKEMFVREISSGKNQKI